MFKKLKLRGKMLISILGLNVIMLSFIFGFYYLFCKKMIVEETQKKAMAKVEGVANILQGHLREKANIGWTLSHDPELVRWLEKNSIRYPDPARDKVYASILEKMETYTKADGEINSTSVASERTQNYYESQGRRLPDDYLVGTRAWYSNAVAKGKPSFDVDVDYIGGFVAVSYRCPIYSDEGNLLGVGGIDMRLNYLEKYLKKLVKSFDTGDVYLVNEEGLFLFHPDKEYVLKKRLADIGKVKDNKGLQNVIERVKNSEQGIDLVSLAGKKKYFISTPIKELNWMLVLAVSTKEINGPLGMLANTSIMIIFLTAIAMFVSIFTLSDSITKPISQLVEMVKGIAQGKGDLTKRLDIQSEDEVGELAHWFNLFIDKLHDVILLVKVNADEISGATGNLSATASELASGANAQNTQAAEVASSVQEMAAVIVQNAQSATTTATIAQEACDKANSGAEVMQETQKVMDDIVASSEKTGSIVNVLSKRTIQIGEIIRIIDDIAVQTNLLALNAAIEASSAGENGKGFAVVAEEVRKLAVRTKEATKEIAGTILEIKRDTDQVSNAMDKSMLAIGKGKEATVKTEAVLQEIVGSVGEAMTMVQQIATGSEEQKFGAEEISRGMSAISNVTNESASGAEQMAAFARQLDTQSSSLKDLVSQFKLRNN